MGVNDHWRQDVTHYEVLGVAADADATQIKQAYRRLARLHHPDKGGDAQKFSRLQAAADVLLDPKQRAVYQASATEHAPPPPVRPEPEPEQHESQQQQQPVTLADVWASDDDEDEVEEGGGERHTSGTAAGPPGPQQAAASSGVVEGVLLDMLTARGVQCNSATQLVVTCEVCRRPATRRCWVCTCDLCELCTRALHRKGEWGLHWPLVNAPGSLSHSLALKEFERKRIEDAHKYEAAQPGYMSEARRMVVRDFQEAAARAALQPGAQRRYVHALARHYMWAQTDIAVHIAVHVPQGVPGKEARAQLEAGPVLCVWASSSNNSVDQQDEPPQPPPPERCVITRQLAGDVDTSLPMDVLRTPDNRFLVLVLPKAELGRTWRRLFVGDSDGARGVAAGGPGGYRYRLQQDETEVVLEVDLPSWVRPTDVDCQVDAAGMRLQVQGLMDMTRTFWGASPDSGSSSAKPPANIIDPSRCTWSVTPAAATPAAGSCSKAADLAGPTSSSSGGAVATTTRGRPGKVLTVLLAKRPLTLEEKQFKHGVLQDNLAAKRLDGRPGPAAFFVEDEDEWGLSALLQASVYRAAGSVFISPRPWEAGPGSCAGAGRWCRCLGDLPQDVAKLVEASTNSQPYI